MIRIAAILCILIAGSWFATLDAQPTVDLRIQNVTVIDVRKGKAIAGQDVYVDAGHILEIVPTSQKGATARETVDGTGKFLIPGLWDMHTHNWWNIHFSGDYVANGVLGLRNMYTPMQMIAPLKDSINNNLLLGPQYFAAGRVIEGADPEFPDWLVVDEIRKIKPALDTLQMEGSDFVKIYNKVPREVYFELMKEAKRRGMIVEGHLPMSVSAIEASRAGQRSFEHLLGIPDLCTRDTLFRNKYKFNWFAAVMKENDYGTLTIDEQLAFKNFAILRKNDTYVCPTMVVWNSYFHPDTPFENDPWVKKYPNEMLQFWAGEMEKYRKKDAGYKAMALKKYATFQRIAYLLYKAGVPMMAGTDAINPYCYPGYSLHKELELLHDCGIPNDAILRMATLNPVNFLRLNNQGEIKRGHLASMVLLDANPLVDIRNTQKIHAVILKGRFLDRAALQRLSGL